MIIQYESLHHIPRFFNYVVVDEIRALISCMTSTATNGVHIRTNVNVLTKLIQESDLSIFLGADIEVDNAVPFFLKHVVDTDRIHVVRYSKTLIQRNLHIMYDEEHFAFLISRSLENGIKVGIGCQSKKRALM